MAKMDREQMTLVTIHDRPEKTELGEYDYVIECEDATYDSYCKLEEIRTFHSAILAVLK